MSRSSKIGPISMEACSPWRRIADRPEHRLVTIAVSGVSAVEGFPNLFAGAPGTQLEVVFARPRWPNPCGSAPRSAAASRRGGPTVVIGDRCMPR